MIKSSGQAACANNPSTRGRQKQEDCHRFKVHMGRPIAVRARLSVKNRREIRAEV